MKVKFFSTILILFLIEFANGQVSGTAIINNALFAKFTMSVTVNSTSSITFNIDAVGGVGRITEVGVVYGIAKGLTTTSTLARPSATSPTFGSRIATISYTSNQWLNTINLTVLSTETTNSQGTTTFYVAPYYAKLYAIKNGVTYYGPEIEFLPNWPIVSESGTTKDWCEANLGALRVATSGTDTDSYGFKYQWGRGTDGHQFQNSPTTTTQSTGDNPGNPNFVIQGSNGNWRSAENNSLWAGVSGTNNPCPSGWRIPTKLEWYSFMRNNSGNNSLVIRNSLAFGSILKVPASQSRHRNTAVVNSVNHNFLWMLNWSEGLGGYGAWNMTFYADGWYEGNGVGGESFGGAIRCIQD